MDIYEILKVIGLSILPIAELRGGIPYGILQAEMNPVLVYFISCSANILAFPAVFLFINLFHGPLLKWGFYERMFEKIVARTRRKLESKVEKYGFWALMIFVMIPLPVTGAYTGSLAAWIFGLPRKKAFFAVTLGVLIAGIIVTAVVESGSALSSIFTKKL